MANVSASGTASVPWWCSLIPASGSLITACAPVSEADSATAAINKAQCADYASTNYPTLSSVLGPSATCSLVMGDYNGPIFLAVLAIGIVAVVMVAK